ncbi:MAG: HlyD family efflux transporter periplasmic adaptor subunit, partial [bacterium]|nr:HlyD family efflux transporter periplasmic adaptor subunit [bacterium]
ALHIKDGAKGVYVKYGDLQRFRRITILYEDENYILVPKDGALGTENEVRLYDEVIVEGTNLQDGKLL